MPPLQQPALVQLLECGFYCNNAHLSGESGTGDPTELALRISGAKAELVADGARRLVEIPFESSAKFMAVVVDIDDRRLLLVKGAPEVVVPMCSSALDDAAGSGELNPSAALETARTFARDALRTLGFAVKELPKDQADLGHADLQDMSFAGLQGMIDPPRQSAVKAVDLCKRAGIRTVMITGDHPETALAVASQLGIAANQVVTG